MPWLTRWRDARDLCRRHRPQTRSANCDRTSRPAPSRCRRGAGHCKLGRDGRFPLFTAFTLADDNEALRTLALDLMRGSFRFGEANYPKGDARKLLAVAEPVELVIATT